MTQRIAILGTLDTKGTEIAFLKEEIERHGHATLVVDLGILAPPPFKPDVTREEVAQAGGHNLKDLAASGDRGRAVQAMTDGIAALAPALHADGKFDAIIAMGGSGGTVMATAAMRALPLGVPKVMLSTLAGGDVKNYVGVKDIVMIPSIVDISGLNRLSRRIIAQAAGAVCGMAETDLRPAQDRPLICASMFGNTTACVEAARARLEEAGYEVLVFHAVGTGGRTMESLIEAGYVTGVFDVTTTEWADELIGGVLGAGPTRMEAAARSGTPAVLAPGCLDMVNFWAPETVPPEFKDRLFYQHNANVTLMRTTPEECAQLGRIFAEKANLSTGPVAVFLPLGGVSVISKPGGPFHSPEADEALFSSIKRHLRKDIPLHERPEDVNHPDFARAMTDGLLEMIRVSCLKIGEATGALP